MIMSASLAKLAMRTGGVMQVKMRRLAFIGAVCVIAVITGSASAYGATTTRNTVAASFCSGTDAIPMADLASPLSLSNCPVQGRLIVREVDGFQMGVHVPKPGSTEGESALTKSGDYDLAVTNENGHVTARTTFPAVKAKGLSPKSKLTVATADPACNELTVAYMGYVWDETLKWYYNESTASRAALDGPTTLQEIRQANANITTGANNCGWPVGNFGSYIGGVPLGAYQGTTAAYANISPDGKCSPKFSTDTQNTVSWGPFNAGVDALALTCTRWVESGNNYFAVETDTYIGSNANIYTTEPAACNNEYYDLQTVMTHEWGHAYGLDHESADPDEVMFDEIWPCANRHHLGWGDYEGMADLYGAY
jgi:hypothetical protein